MSKPANTKIIGAFVVGGIVLGIVAVLIFGGAGLFQERRKFVSYFEGSVSGLSNGASVVFRGVKIGSVTDISLWYDPKDMTFLIPVIFEIELDRISVVKGAVRTNDIKALIEKGLRAELQLQSFVTGQLMIELDFHPEKNARFVGGKSHYEEIPTLPTKMQEIAKTLDKFPFDEFATKLTSAIDNIASQVQQIQLSKTLENADKALDEIRGLIETLNSSVTPIAASLDETIRDGQKLIQRLDSQVDPLSKGIEKAVGEARSVFADTRKLVQKVDGQSGKTMSSLQTALESANVALKRAETALNSLADMTSENSNLRYQLADMMEELSAAARSIRVLADYLERNPDALIRGKAPKGGR
jgi:phospholipid/cholesterol/gamma-HCH transport system substrate-binding protein